jgi:hypothetical protein
MKTPRWHTREDSGLRIDRHGQWWHDDEKIEHPNIIEAFNRGLRVMEDGKYQLHFGNDWCFVQVEHCGFTVVAVDEAEGDRLSVRLSDRTAEFLELESVREDEEGVLIAKVKEGKALARFSRDAQYQFAEHLEETDGKLFIRVGARVVPLTRE